MSRRLLRGPVLPVRPFVAASGSDITGRGRSADLLRGGLGREICIGDPGKTCSAGCKVVRP